MSHHFYNRQRGVARGYRVETFDPNSEVENFFSSSGNLRSTSIGVATNSSSTIGCFSSAKSSIHRGRGERFQISEFRFDKGEQRLINPSISQIDTDGLKRMEGWNLRNLRFIHGCTAQASRRRKKKVENKRVTAAISAIGQMLANTVSAGRSFRKIPLTMTMM